MNKTARGCESGPGATLTVDASTLIDDPLIMTDAFRQTVADVRAMTVVHLIWVMIGVRHRTMIVVFVTLKIITHLALLTDACLMGVAFLIMSIVRYQKRFTLGILRRKIVHKKLS